jgi:hypothetical protein
MSLACARNEIESKCSFLPKPRQALQHSKKLASINGSLVPSSFGFHDNSKEAIDNNAYTKTKKLIMRIY